MEDAHASWEYVVAQLNFLCLVDGIEREILVLHNFLHEQPVYHCESFLQTELLCATLFNVVFVEDLKQWTKHFFG